MQQPDPIIKDLVLVGGGHSHAIALKLFGMNPVPGVRLTLITNTSHTPYSGMLPGYVAGFYSFDETHIDLRRLARFSGAQFYLDRAVGLDLVNHKVICADRPPVAFDYLSLDIGSTPAQISVPGAAEYAVPAKPVPKFLASWNQLLKTVRKNPEKPLSIGIVGGGAGGVELALNMQHHLLEIKRGDGYLRAEDGERRTEATLTSSFPNFVQALSIFLRPHPSSFLPASVPDALQIHLFHRGTRLVSNRNRSVSRRLEKLFQTRGIKLHLQANVREVLPKKVICESGLMVECDRIFWVTQASAPSWIKASGLARDAQGFALVNDMLQSVSHPHVFAAGDIATMKNYARPKAGVFAVRQGKPLFKNLRRTVLGKSLKTYTPQKWYLSLIGTGDKSAIATWGFFSCQSPLLWRWKDFIDRKFMRRFHELPEMGQDRETGKKTIPFNLHPSPLPPTPHTLPPIPCAGCGSKVGRTILERVWQRLQIPESPDVLIGLKSPDDAAVVQVSAGQLMVHTIDYFRSLINDPFIFGQIATNHCLSDVYAMGASPHTALAVVTVPYGAEAQLEEALYQLLAGSVKVLQQAQTSLVGGHTTEGAELAFGLSCNGVGESDRLLRKSGLKPGQVLILTKPIGTGTLFAADMRYRAKGRWIDEALESMLLSNQGAAKIFQEYKASACTDITGFGLLGHLAEMVWASGVEVQLDLEAVPILDGAIATSEMGITSSLLPQNLNAFSSISHSRAANSVLYSLLFDPQTAGGLLAAVPSERASACIEALKAAGYSQSLIVGQVTELTKSPAIVVQ